MISGLLEGELFCAEILNAKTNSILILPDQMDAELTYRP